MKIFNKKFLPIIWIVLLFTQVSDWGGYFFSTGQNRGQFYQRYVNIQGNKVESYLIENIDTSFGVMYLVPLDDLEEEVKEVEIKLLSNSQMNSFIYINKNWGWCDTIGFVNLDRIITIPNFKYYGDEIEWDSHTSFNNYFRIDSLPFNAPPR